MKKNRQFMMLSALVVMTSTLFAQLPNGSYAKDFSLKKLSSDGQVITDTVCTVYEHTNAGRPVVMDLSGIWCSYCWSYHNTHALNTLYETYGPNGSNEVMVYFVEADKGTIRQLNGDLTDNTNGKTTKGDWVTGTPYPILPTIAPNSQQVVTDYKITYFPTIYLICPDRSVTDAGKKTAEEHIVAARACPVLTTHALDAKVFNVNAFVTTIFCGKITPKLTIQNYGTDPITSATIKMYVDDVEATSYNWTGNIARLEIADIVMPLYTDPLMTVGTHAVKFVVESPNGGTDLNLANNEITVTVNNVGFGAYPVTESFASSLFPPANWNKVDGTDGEGWVRTTTHGGCAKINFFEITSGKVDYLVMPPVDMTSASTMSLTFKVAYAQYDASFMDKLDVQVSTDCGVTWTSKFSKSGTDLSTSAPTSNAFTPTSESQWRQETVNLDSCAGNAKVMIRFKSTSRNGNNCYIDEINLDPTAGVKSGEIVSGMNLFPNPSNGNTNLEFFSQTSANISVVVTNTIGSVVSSSEFDAAQGFNTIQIPSEKFESGLYFVTLKGDCSHATQKLVIQK